VLVEMADADEAVVVDGLATRVQRPRGWANQKVLYDAKRHSHTAQGLSVATIWGDLLWLDGGWPGSCHEHELIKLAGLAGVLDEVEVATLLDRGFRGLAKGREHWHAPVGDRRTIDRLSQEQGPTTVCRRGCARWWNSRSPTWPTPGCCAAGAGCCTGPRRLPGRRRADLPGPLAAPRPHMKSITDTLNRLRV